MNLIYLIVIGFIVLSVVYGIVWIYSRSVRREKLEDRWDAENPQSTDTAAREAYIEQGMAEYHAGFRPKLILLVYIIPTVLVIGTLIATNWN